MRRHVVLGKVADEGENNEGGAETLLPSFMYLYPDGARLMTTEVSFDPYLPVELRPHTTTVVTRPS